MIKTAWFFLYLLILLVEILKANIQVIKRILLPIKNLSPCIFVYESDLRSDFGLFVLANSITLTPGTLTISIEKSNSLDQRSKLIVHSLHCPDLEEMKSSIRNDFETKIRRFAP